MEWEVEREIEKEAGVEEEVEEDVNEVEGEAEEEVGGEVVEEVRKEAGEEATQVGREVIEVGGEVAAEATDMGGDARPTATTSQPPTTKQKLLDTLQLRFDIDPNTPIDQKKAQFTKLKAYAILKMLAKHNEQFEGDLLADEKDVVWCTNRFGERVFSYLKSLLDKCSQTRDMILSSIIKLLLALLEEPNLSPIATLAAEDEKRFEDLRKRTRKSMDHAMKHAERDEKKLELSMQRQEEVRRKEEAKRIRKQLEAPYLDLLKRCGVVDESQEWLYKHNMITFIEGVGGDIPTSISKDEYFLEFSACIKEHDFFNHLPTIQPRNTSNSNAITNEGSTYTTNEELFLTEMLRGLQAKIQARLEPLPVAAPTRTTPQPYAFASSFSGGFPFIPNITAIATPIPIVTHTFAR